MSVTGQPLAELLRVSLEDYKILVVIESLGLENEN